MGGQQPNIIFGRDGEIKTNLEVEIEVIKEQLENLHSMLNTVIDYQKKTITMLNVEKEEQDVKVDSTKIGIRALMKKHLSERRNITKEMVVAILVKENYIKKSSRNGHGYRYDVLTAGIDAGWLSTDHGTALLFDETKIDKIIEFLEIGYKKHGW